MGRILPKYETIYFFYLTFDTVVFPDRHEPGLRKCIILFTLRNLCRQIDHLDLFDWEVNHIIVLCNMNLQGDYASWIIVEDYQSAFPRTVIDPSEGHRTEARQHWRGWEAESLDSRLESR